jgi:hypothetical protein
MANRPDYSPDVPLTAKEVAEVWLRYAQLNRPGLREPIRRRGKGAAWMPGVGHRRACIFRCSYRRGKHCGSAAE